MATILFLLAAIFVFSVVPSAPSCAAASKIGCGYWSAHSIGEWDKKLEAARARWFGVTVSATEIRQFQEDHRRTRASPGQWTQWVRRKKYTAKYPMELTDKQAYLYDCTRTGGACKATLESGMVQFGSKGELLKASYSLEDRLKERRKVTSLYEFYALTIRWDLCKCDHSPLAGRLCDKAKKYRNEQYYPY